MPREATQDRILHDPGPLRRVANRRSYYTSVLEIPEDGSSQPVIQNHYLPKPSLAYRSAGRIVQTQIPSRTSHHREEFDRTDSPRTAGSVRSSSFPNADGGSFPDAQSGSRSRSMVGNSQRLPALHINTNIPHKPTSSFSHASLPNLVTSSTMKVLPTNSTHPTFTASKPLCHRPQTPATSICLSFPSPPLPTTLPNLKSLEKSLSAHLTALASHLTTVKTLTHPRPLSKLKKAHERTSLLLLSNLTWYSHTTIRQLPPSSPLRSEWIVQISVSWERKIEALWEEVRREVDALVGLYVEDREWVRTLVGNGKEWERCRRKWCARFEEKVRDIVEAYEKFWRGRIRDGVRGRVWNVALDG